MVCSRQPEFVLHSLDVDEYVFLDYLCTKFLLINLGHICSYNLFYENSFYATSTKSQGAYYCFVTSVSVQGKNGKYDFANTTKKS